MRKRFLSLCLAFLMAVSVLSGIEFGRIVKAEEYDGFEYEINDSGTVTITGCDYRQEEIVIPEKINGIYVTAIANGTFTSEKWGIGKGDYYVYFSEESNVRKVTIPKSVKEIEVGTFNFCYLLEEIVVDINNEYYSSENGILFNKDKTELLRFPCRNSVVEYTIPDSVTSIGSHSFAYCTDLIKVDIGKKITSIPGEAFVCCTSVEEVILPEGLQTISMAAFGKCISLKNVTIPESTLKIENSAFGSCKSITSINIPKNVNGVNDSTFSGCDSLESISVDKANMYYSDEDGVLFNKDKTKLLVYPSGRISYNYCIPESVEYIEDYVFYSCKGLYGITISDNLTEESFGFYGISGMFSHCDNLENIYVNENNNTYTDINGVLFSKDKTQLILYPRAHRDVNYSIPEGTVYANVEYSSIEELIIPKSLRGISTDYCTSLSFISVDEGNSCYAGIDGVLFNNDKTVLYTIPIAYEERSYKVPEGVNEIDYGAIRNCINLEEVTLSNTVATIGGLNFLYCNSLKNIYVDEGNSVYCDVKGVLFNKNMTSLIRCPEGYEDTEYVVPNGVTKIENSAFSCCSRIESVKVPTGVDTIYPGTFSSCESLKTVLMEDSVTKISFNGLVGCTNLENIIIKNSECEIDELGVYGNGTNTKIYGYDGSTAQSYAQKQNIEFVSIQCEDNVHVWNEYATVEREATCNSSGWQSVRCMICDSMQDSSQSTIPALGHDIVDGKCTRCGQDPLLYDAYEGEAYIYGYIGDEIDVVIPEEIDGNKVTTIILEGKGLEWPSEIRSFTIPSTVNYIDKKEYWNVDFDLEVIYGYTGSYAETYANENGITFIALDENKSGDVDDNGEVNLKDYAMLLRYVAGWDVEINTVNADVNKDGAINLKDYVLIQRYVAGWDVELN